MIQQNGTNRMAIKRAARPAQAFTQLRNDVLRDDRISYRARGLLSAILSYPDDWATSSEALARAGQEGRDAIRTALSELEGAGYLKREKSQDERGRWATHSVIYDTPNRGQNALFGTDDGLPGVGYPVVGFPGPIKNTDYKHSSPNGEAAEAAPADEPKAKAPEDIVAKAVYDHADGMAKYVAVRQVAQRALKVKGQTVEAVTAAMIAVYDMGKPLTLEAVGQHITGRTNQGRGWTPAAQADRSAHSDHWAQPGATW